METTLQTIKNSMHNPNGLSAAVEAVSTALGEWDREVTEKTNALKNRLKDLKNNDFSNFSSSLDALKSCDSGEVAAKLEACISNASYMFHALMLIEKCFDDLDPELQNKLKDYLSRVKFEVGTLFAAAKNEPVKAVVETAGSELKGLETKVKSEVSTRVDHLHKRIDEEFNKKIFTPILDVKGKLENIHKDLETWKQAAHAMLYKAEQKCGEIIKKAATKSNEEGEIFKSAKDLRAKAEELLKAYETAKKSVPKLVYRLKEKVDELEEIYKKKLVAVKTAVDKAVDSAVGSLSAVDEAVLNGLRNLRDHTIKQAISSFAKKLNTAEFEKAAQGHTNVYVGVNISSLESLNGTDLKTWLTQASTEGLTKVKDLFGKPYEKSRPESSVRALLYAILGMTDELSVASNATSGFDAIGKDFHTAICNAINGDAGSINIEKVMEKYYAQTKRIGTQNGVFTGIIKKIKDPVKTDGFSGEGDGAKFDPKKMYGYDETSSGGDPGKRGALTVEIVRVNKVLDAFTTGDHECPIPNGDVYTKKTELQSSLNKITREIQQITDILSKEGEYDHKGVKCLLTELRTTGIHGIGENDWANKTAKGLEKIRQQLADIIGDDGDSSTEAAPATLLGIINNAGIFYKDVNDIVAFTISGVQTYVTSQVSEVTKMIQSRAKHEYYSRIHPMFESMKTRVSARIDVINNTIDKDLRSNVKGLLRLMMDHEHKHDHHENKLGKLKLAGKPENEKVKTLSGYLLKYTALVLDCLKDQVKKPLEDMTNPSPTSLPTDPANKLTKIKTNFDRLLTHLGRQLSDKKYNYDYEFVKLRDSLSSSLHLLSPSHFANPRHPELLDAVKKGLQGFVDEMGRVYVNGYDDGTLINFTSNPLVETNFKSNSGQIEKLTPYGEKLSKVFLTLLDIIHRDMYTLKHSSLGGWNKHSIIATTNLGIFLKGCGYIVSDSADIQNGHLGRTVQGNKVGELCNHQITVSQPATQNVLEIYVSLTNNNVKLSDFLDVLYTMLHKYRYVCHLRHIPGAKPPTTVNQMLHWFTGMPWHPICKKLKDRLNTLLKEQIDEYQIKNSTIPVTVPSGKGWTTTTVNIRDFTQVFENVMTRSPKILVTILGHGDADGRYGCDFFTNPDDLLYPGSPDQCLDMLVDIALRLNHQIRFLYKMFQNGKRSSGWRDCWYGKHVAGSAWNCNRYPCDEQDCDQKHNQSGNQTADQNIKCGIKSPLQSFLEDGLPGFLPHSFKKPGCKLECNVSNHRGIPCKTPMGFRDLSITASHRRTGQDLRKVLDGFCGITNESLSLLCTYFLCLLRRPPQTLCDMFAFYHNFLEHWTGDYGNRADVKKHKKEAFEKAVRDANFGIEDTTLDVASLQDGRDHGKHYSAQDKKHTGDLFSLICCEPGKPATLPCGSYLQPLSLDIRCVFSETYASLYMSWIVYMTETFYSLLKELYEKCCNSCNKRGGRCYDRTCAEKCTVQSTLKDGKLENVKTLKHEDKCNSIVQCRDTHATIFAAGFTLGSPYEMSGEKGQDRKRTCQDFCEALNKVVKDGSVLYDLVHKHIPNFLWEIREKFFWTTVALWSASFLYLIYVMVGRLDLLHIKSHLRSPASHRIAAQSLLAAARVGRLTKISYLQP